MLGRTNGTTRLMSPRAEAGLCPRARARLAVSASGVEDGTVAYFTNIPADKLPPEPEYQPVQFGIEHVLASGSFPGGFPWTTIRNRAYWDGGLTEVGS